MEILIVFSSESGNTKRVVKLLQLVLEKKNHSVKVKNALTVVNSDFKEADVTVIGTPVHGYILFGQKPASGVRGMLESGLPLDLEQKPVIGFATYLFFPAGALNIVKKTILAKNGKYLTSFSARRSKKEALATEIAEYIERVSPTI